jgi:hypothetical protein
MAIPSSGDISLTTIQAEFGGANPISLSEYYAGGGQVPSGTTGTYGAVPSSGALSIQQFYGTSNVVYFLATFGVNISSTYYNLNSNGVDSSNNYYFFGTGRNAATGANTRTILKLTSDGVEVFQKYLGTATDGYRMNLSSSGDIYTLGSGPAVGGIANTTIVKHDSSGNLTWQRWLGKSGSNVFVTGVGVDSSGNVYGSGYADMNGQSYDFYACKFNSSGTLQWQKNLGRSYNQVPQGQAYVDSSGNLYMAGYDAFYNYSVGGVRYLASIIKYDASGVLQFQRNYYTNIANYSFLNTVIGDASGNIFVTGTDGNPYIAKLNSGGYWVWGKTLSASTFNSIAFDSAGNLYACGEEVWAKWDSAGVLQWQREIVTNSTSTRNFYYITLDNSDNLLLSGIYQTFSQGKGLILKYPSDGSFTGSVILDGVTFTIQASSFTSGTYTPPNQVNSSLTQYTTVASTGTQTMTDGNSAMTLTKANL